jgi:hypothetical protein
VGKDQKMKVRKSNYNKQQRSSAKASRPVAQAAAERNGKVLLVTEQSLDVTYYCSFVSSNLQTTKTVNN